MFNCKKNSFNHNRERVFYQSTKKNVQIGSNLNKIVKIINSFKEKARKFTVLILKENNFKIDNFRSFKIMKINERDFVEVSNATGHHYHPDQNCRRHIRPVFRTFVFVRVGRCFSVHELYFLRLKKKKISTFSSPKKNLFYNNLNVYVQKKGDYVDRNKQLLETICFNYLSVAEAIINGKIIYMHRGDLSPSELKSTKVPNRGLLCNLLLTLPQNKKKKKMPNKVDLLGYLQIGKITLMVKNIENRYDEDYIETLHNIALKNAIKHKLKRVNKKKKKQ
ncbi:hypothetical protein RFI_26293 [Reticulomyxa filosa]|uniref:Uncharacterized protein n=1 Tax=Reticulomyxa filosa TaxID=46433 RepID=X6MAP3_RETFI|nr:hypothetical protein RFI_26293 [Reticulomyxa filosa]|eukprot:ETO11083.1 hypothetical protein RFI_26293 [Reticulomyxa filosa]